ncbi:glycosyltransferase [Pedobacter africanus]|nr:glycosyltransferase [Pedobacter africanus]
MHIITSLGVGGAETMLSKIVLGRKKQGLDDVVICLTARDKIGDLLVSNNVQVYYLNMNSFSTSVKALFLLNKLLKEYSPEIVQTWLYHADFIGGIIAKLRKIKVVWNIRQTKFTSLASFTTIIIMRLCAVLSYFVPSKIVCAANASLQQHAKFGYSRKKLVVIPNGFVAAEDIDSKILNELKTELNIDTGTLIVGTVGRFHHDKDYLTFIKAAAIVVREKPFTKFLMVGKNLDVNNKTLMEWISAEHLVSNFILIGETRNVNLYLSILDVFCLSSISEGFPNVVGEAMLKGVPCVVTDSGDSKFVVGDTGTVVMIKNPELLAIELIRFLEMSNIDRISLGQEAKMRIMQNFMIDEIVAEYSLLYNHLSNNK